jgi:UTP-glucose-1-phosphate uridylyltransferase
MNPRPELAKNQPFYGLEFDGRSFDCGSKAGFLSANVANAIERSDGAAGADGNAWSGKLVISSKGTCRKY